MPLIAVPGIRYIYVLNCLVLILVNTYISSRPRQPSSIRSISTKKTGNVFILKSSHGIRVHLGPPSTALLCLAWELTEVSCLTAAEHNDGRVGCFSARGRWPLGPRETPGPEYLVSYREFFVLAVHTHPGAKPHLDTTSRRTWFGKCKWALNSSYFL